MLGRVAVSSCPTTRSVVVSSAAAVVAVVAAAAPAPLTVLTVTSKVGEDRESSHPVAQAQKDNVREAQDAQEVAPSRFVVRERTS